MQRAIVQVLRRMLRTERSLDDLWEANLQQTHSLGRRSGRTPSEETKQAAVRLAGERTALRMLRAEAENARARPDSSSWWDDYEPEPEPEPAPAMGPEEMIVMARHGWRPTVSGGLPGLGRRQ